MLLRRAALPFSLLALLASAGCVSVGPESGAPGPLRDPVPPADAPDAPDGPDARRASGPAPELPLPLGEVPDPEPEPPAPPPARAARPPAERPAKPAAPRRARPPQPPAPRVPRQPAAPRLLGGEELCEAAQGAVPPSIVDLCVRQYGR
ncbi:hypothetical protein [Streptomyces sp. NBC_00091]|uniref:hypothetical protein n=1 Tax=Streptomyces sp. NBC_00091 TaxID=2975648 RepID=UPI00224E9389|nr:hypothetical protein [Streptomyces sp. NBC_00091]MCX5379995.1 hypothetical protein [Streptomyces sp. NBC_00091]